MAQLILETTLMSIVFYVRDQTVLTTVLKKVRYICKHFHLDALESSLEHDSFINPRSRVT